MASAREPEEGPVRRRLIQGMGGIRRCPLGRTVRRHPERRLWRAGSGLRLLAAHEQPQPGVQRPKPRSANQEAASTRVLYLLLAAHRRVLVMRSAQVPANIAAYATTPSTTARKCLVRRRRRSKPNLTLLARRAAPATVSMPRFVYFDPQAALEITSCSKLSPISEAVWIDRAPPRRYAVRASPPVLAIPGR
jgi:hypothetical protein